MDNNKGIISKPILNPSSITVKKIIIPMERFKDSFSLGTRILSAVIIQLLFEPEAFHFEA